MAHKKYDGTIKITTSKFPSNGDILEDTKQVLDIFDSPGWLKIRLSFADQMIDFYKERYGTIESILKSETKEPPKILTERSVKLNELAVYWVELNQNGKQKSFNIDEFLQDYLTNTGLYISKAEFKKHLPKAYKWGIIDKDKKTGRYIPKSGN